MDPTCIQNPPKRYQCDTCMKSYDVYSTFYSHKQSHAPKSVQCKACKQMFSTKTILYRHYYNLHSDITRSTKTDSVPNVQQPLMDNTNQRKSNLNTRIFDIEY